MRHSQICQITSKKICFLVHSVFNLWLKKISSRPISLKHRRQQKRGSRAFCASIRFSSPPRVTWWLFFMNSPNSYCESLKWTPYRNCDFLPSLLWCLSEKRKPPAGYPCYSFPLSIKKINSNSSSILLLRGITLPSALRLAVIIKSRLLITASTCLLKRILYCPVKLPQIF